MQVWQPATHNERKRQLAERVTAAERFIVSHARYYFLGANLTLQNPESSVSTETGGVKVSSVH